MKLLQTFGFFLAATAAAFAQQPPPRVAPSATPAATPTPASTPAPPPLSSSELINLLNDAQLEQAVQTLKAQFLNPAALNDQELRRARLEGLLERLGPGANLFQDSAKPADGDPIKFLAEVLDSRVGYVRLGKLDADTLTQLDAVLAGFNEKKIRAVVLDLRSVGYSSDYELAGGRAPSSSSSMSDGSICTDQPWDSSNSRRRGEAEARTSWTLRPVPRIPGIRCPVSECFPAVCARGGRIPDGWKRG